MKLEKLENIYYKNTDSQDSEMNFGTLGITKEFSVEFSDATSLTSLSEFTYDIIYNDNDIYKLYYASTMMKSYTNGAINNWNGTHAFKWEESTGNYIPDKRMSNTLIEIKDTLTSSVDLYPIAIFTAKTKYIGDNIEAGSLEFYDSASSRMFYSTENSKSDSFFDVCPDEEYFSAVSSSLTAPHYLGWCLKNNGISCIWSDNFTLTSSLTAVKYCNFKGVLYINNITANIVINQDEFNTTTNKSYEYINAINDRNIVNTTYITSVGFWNSYGDLLIVAKPSHPIRKYIDVPITIKLQFDW
jgi:hypothetical protein